MKPLPPSAAALILDFEEEIYFVTVCGILQYQWTGSSPPPHLEPCGPVNESVSAHVWHPMWKAELQDDYSIKGRMVTGWRGGVKKWEQDSGHQYERRHFLIEGLEVGELHHKLSL